MERGLYSKSRLCFELGVDRRTLDARLDGVVPSKDGAKNAKNFYLKDVFRVFLTHAEETARASKRIVTTEEKAAAAEEMANAKLRKEVAEAELVEIKLAKERGELVEADRVEEIWGNLVASFKARLLSLPSRASVQTAGLDRKQVERRLDDMVREALEELSRNDSEEEEFEEFGDEAETQ